MKTTKCDKLKACVETLKVDVGASTDNSSRRVVEYSIQQIGELNAYQIP